jgi:hypothetical protein
MQIDIEDRGNPAFLVFGFYDDVEMAHKFRAIAVHHTQGMYRVTFLEYDHGLF